MRDYKVRCIRPEDHDKVCEGRREPDAYVWWHWGFIPANTIYICPRFFELNADEQASRYLHEVSHYAAGTHDDDLPDATDHRNIPKVGRHAETIGELAARNAKEVIDPWVRHIFFDY